MSKSSIILLIIVLFGLLISLQTANSQTIIIEQQVQEEVLGVDVNWPIKLEYENFYVVADYNNGLFKCIIQYSNIPNPVWKNTPEYAQEIYNFLKRGECYQARSIVQLKG
jgi:hypothetical protein